MEPKITVIIATYNSGNTIKNALDSVLQQQYKNWECLIIDGASKDNTIDIIKEYELKDLRFRHISEPDKGIYDAYNKGWKNAKGEWILYLGSDDLLFPNALKDLINSISDTDVVYGDVILLFPNGKRKLQKAREPSRLKDADQSPCCHQSMIMRKDVFSIMNGFNENYKLLADKDLLVRSYMNGIRFKQINSTISQFSITGVSQTNYVTPIELYRIYRRYHSKAYSLFYFIKKLCLFTMITYKHKFFDS